MVGGRINQKLKAFDEMVAFHQHMAIQSDLNELIFNEAPKVPPLHSLVKPIPSPDSCFAHPRLSASSETSLESSLLSVSSLGTPSSSPPATYRAVLDEVLSLPCSASVKRFCKVQFKCLYRNYVLPDHLTHIQVGEFLIVQSMIDKLHEDLGVVVELYTHEEFSKMNAMMGPSEDADENKVGQVLRIASEEDKKFLPLKHEREGPLLRACQTFVERFCLDMIVYGVEYQFDGNVLFIYYVSKGRVDFRSLVQHIVRIYCRKTRIQMKKTNQCREFLPERFAGEALCTGLYRHPSDPPLEGLMLPNINPVMGVTSSAPYYEQQQQQQQQQFPVMQQMHSPPQPMQQMQTSPRQQHQGMVGASALGFVF